MPLVHENDHALVAALSQNSGVLCCNDFDIVAAAVLAAPGKSAVFRLTKSLFGPVFVSDTSSAEVLRRFEASLATAKEVSARVMHELAVLMDERKKIHNPVRKPKKKKKKKPPHHHPSLAI